MNAFVATLIAHMVSTPAHPAPLGSYLADCANSEKEVEVYTVASDDSLGFQGRLDLWKNDDLQKLFHYVYEGEGRNAAFNVDSCELFLDVSEADFKEVGTEAKIDYAKKDVLIYEGGQE